MKERAQPNKLLQDAKPPLVDPFLSKANSTIKERVQPKKLLQDVEPPFVDPYLNKANSIKTLLALLLPIYSSK